MFEGFDEEPLVLALLSDAELLEQLHEDLYDGLAEEVLEGTLILLNRGWESRRVLREALLPALVAAALDHADGLLDDSAAWSAVDALSAAIEALRPVFAHEKGLDLEAVRRHAQDIPLTPRDLPATLARSDHQWFADWLRGAGLVLRT